ncbi:MAG: bifunctional 5,10-methylenetetrahydrofolate dehydrogenase/5,10-methenyltetrahydrofolate cyclohydrolase [Clostridia bacterium]|jgi:methylenetetrahydrofolate dehydrogenase (NADP+)/methenyltetrahydrofolate cyclohydrolase|nr:bifunctional 5,10-methylenetetrahydrofolate dehydrogenase/5,10-methenyltetrahydrofolate cyclohydrolase [Clostridia bacterium]
MATILSGKEVAAVLKEQNKNNVLALKAQGVMPKLGLIRVGARPDDVYYEGSIKKNCADTGIECETVELPEMVEQQILEKTVKEISQRQDISAIFFFSPLPKHLDEKAARAHIAVAKDVDSLTLGSAAKVFVGDSSGFAPCTPVAVMEILKYYQIPLKGKRVTMLGRSLVVGKPLTMLLLGENATVTVCHSRTEELPKVCREAEVLIAAVGRAKMVKAEYVRAGQVVIDVGINADPDREGKMCGDVDFEAVEPIVDAITPVPGGVGSVTTAVLCKHIIQAAAANAGINL